MKNVYNNLILCCLFILPIGLYSQVIVSSSGLLSNSKSSEALRLSGSSSYLTFYNGATYNGYIWHTNISLYLMNKYATGSLYLGTADDVKMSIKSDGNVGIGITTPDEKLDINAGHIGMDQGRYILWKDGSTEVARMGYTGNTAWMRTTEAGSRIELDGEVDVHFDVNSSTKMLINADGHVGIGTSDPQEELHIDASYFADIRLEADWFKYLRFYEGAVQVGYIGHGTSDMFIENDDVGGDIEIDAEEILRLNTDDLTRMTITKAGDIGIGTVSPAFKLQVAGDVDVTGELTAASDLRLKTNISPINHALSTVKKLNPVSYYFRVDEFPEMGLAERLKMGLIAQEVEKVLPNLVSDAGTSKKANGEIVQIKSVNYMELIPVLLKAIQELESELVNANDRLTNKNDQLIKIEQRLSVLEETFAKNK